LKDIRKLKPGMDLTQSKKLVEELPGIIITGLSSVTVKEWQDSLDPLGAKYELVE